MWWMCKTVHWAYLKPLDVQKPARRTFELLYNILPITL